MQVDIAQMRQHRVVAFAGVHLVAECAEAFRQREQRLIALPSPFLAARQNRLQRLHVLRRLLQQRLHIGRHRAFAFTAQHPGTEAGEACEPFLQLVEEAVLRLSRCQIEKAKHQRAGQAEHGGGECRAHAAQRFGKAGFELLEQRIHIARANRHAGNDVTHRGDRQQQAPERAEQSEEDQQTDHVAGEFTLFIQTAGHRIEQRALRRGGEGEAFLLQSGGAGGHHAGHRGEQLRRLQPGNAGAGFLEGFHPHHFGGQTHHLPQIPENADGQHRQDQRIQQRVGDEGGFQPVEQQKHHGTHRSQKDQHSD